MVWLTGGMFAVACTMIFALLSFILFQGLATHWQRPYLVYALNSNDIIGGELHNDQPYTLNRQSLSSLDKKSLVGAEKLLGDREQTISSQLYLRTGNYDVGNRHFAFVPQVTLSSPTGNAPKDIWLLERREWGVLFGFPSKIAATYSPSSDPGYRSLQKLVDELELLGATPSGERETTIASLPFWEEFKTLVQKKLDDKAAELTKANSLVDFATGDRDKIFDATNSAMSFASRVVSQLERNKNKLGRTDRALSDCRLTVRKAELRDKTDLQQIAEEAIQLATGRGTFVAQSRETMDSIAKWESLFQGDAKSIEFLGILKKGESARLAELLVPIQEAEELLRKRIEALPGASKRSIESALSVTNVATQEQVLVNTELARLEEQSKSIVLSMKLPIAERIGELELPATAPAAEVDSQVLKLMNVGDTQNAKMVSKSQLSDSHSIIHYAIGDDANEFAVLIQDSESGKLIVNQLASKDVFVSDIVRVARPNQLGFFGKLALYAARWFEFLFGQPREAGIEGGFFPALWGTIVMTVIMSVAVMPFGVIAALYMREYAKSGWVLSLIRISINNLAGVPSIVYGVFGLAFFCYTIGGYIDGGPVKAGFEPWPSGTWFVALAVTVACGTVAFFLAAMGSGSPASMSVMRKRIASFSGLFWLVSLLCIIALFAKSPFFNGLFEANLPNPTYGKGCLLWASCTLAILTLPVVIVATEEALAAVPNSLREGSYACGAGKWQTLQRIVLPYARPGIITGFILAMARGAGEVAPMMLVGAIPLATELPLDLEFPFFHGSRSFMHLGFQIYSLGFQSQNSEAAKPMVFTATLLLLTIVTLLNVTAIWLRARLRKRFQGSQF
jgi:ABC-type phosphate transport system permease subunit